VDWRAFTVTVEGARLSGERREGHGTPLVLIHGFGGSRAMWDQLVDALPASLPLIRYDLRGFGASTQDEGIAFSHAADLLALLDSQAVARAHLSGLSLGGAIAVRMALAHPERVERLILASPALMGWEWSAEWAGNFRACVKAARSGDLVAARRLWWENPLFDSLRDTPLAEAMQAEIAAFAGRQWIADTQHAVLPEIENLHRLSLPTLLLTGTKDVADFQLIADALTAAVPNLTRVDFADAGHMLPLERPAEMARALVDFLG